MIIDKSRHFGYSTPKLPKFKGHVKITLHNCRTGKNEVIEGENIVTNAVRDLLAANYLGAVDYNKIFGADGLWRKWFGGVLLYEQAHPTQTVGGVEVLDPDDYFPRADSVSHLFAHAGQNSIDSQHDDDLTRGNPVAAAFVATENTIKQVWEWGSARGNVPDGRYIRALSLTHADTGDAGLGNTGYAFQNFVPFEKIDRFEGFTYKLSSLIFAPYDESNGLAFAIGEDGEWHGGYPGGHQSFETAKVTIYIRKFPFAKAGLFQAIVPNTNLVLPGGATVSIDKQFEITLPFNIYANPCYYFDYTNKKLWLFTNVNSVGASTFSKTDIKWARIDLSDLESVSVEANGTIVSDTSNLAPLGWGDNATNFGRGRSDFSAIVFDGTSFYFPTGSKNSYTGYQRINFANQSDQSTIVFNNARTDYPLEPMYAGGLLVADGRVTNGAVGYNCGTILDYAGQEYSTMRASWLYSQPNKVSSYVMNCDGGSLADASGYVDNWNRRCILANKMLNTTLFNLPNPVQKTSSQSMTVEYTLQEVPEGGGES